MVEFWICRETLSISVHDTGEKGFDRALHPHPPRIEQVGLTGLLRAERRIRQGAGVLGGPRRGTPAEAAQQVPAAGAGDEAAHRPAELDE